MKLLFLSKRYPQGRDLVSRPYGRFYNIPVGLIQIGHKCTLLLLDPKSDKKDCGLIGTMPYRSVGISYRVYSDFLQAGEQIIREEKIDCIVGCSDIWFGLLAKALSKKTELPYVVDAYDNYESYIPWLKPAHWLWRNSLQNANAVVAAGPALADLLDIHRSGSPTTVIPMAADDAFQPVDQALSREQLGMPADKFIVGYCGKLVHRKGGADLYEIADKLSHRQNILFVISGKNKDSGSVRDNIQFLGYLDDSFMPSFASAIDVMLILNHDNSFGRFSYPIKIYEAMRCQTMALSSDLPGTSWILRDYPELLIPPGDTDGFASKILALVDEPVSCAYNGSWKESVELYEKVLLGVLLNSV